MLGINVSYSQFLAQVVDALLYMLILLFLSSSDLEFLLIPLLLKNDCPYTYVPS